MSLRIAALIAASVLLVTPTRSFAADAVDGLTTAQIEALLADSDRHADLYRAFLSGRLTESFDRLTPLAAQGSPTAQYLLGEMRMVDGELDGDPAVAIEWFERSAASGFAAALRRLAHIYSSGYGGQFDPKRSLATRIRYAQVVASISANLADKTKPVLFIHRSGEGPLHRYWKEREGFYRAQIEPLSALASAPAADNSDLNLSKSLPDACRPRTIPSREMAVDKLDVYDGVVTFTGRAPDRIDGIVVTGPGRFGLNVAVLNLFRDSLRSRDCVINFPDRQVNVELPFRFRIF